MKTRVVGMVWIATLAGLFAACTAGDVTHVDPLDGPMSAAIDDEVDTVQSAMVSDCSQPGSQGKRCDDGRFCTVRDRCDDGVCEGEPRACAGSAGFCATPVCDEDQDACTATPADPATCEDKCEGAHAQRAYQRGFRRGWKTVERSWERHVDDCDRTEAFVDRVLARLEHAQSSCDADDDSRYRRCRVAGATAGALAALDQIQAACDESCILDGELVGNMAAQTYCELAIGGAPLDAGPWVRGPLNTCGLEYETSCDSAFIGTSIDYTDANGEACERFTEAPYEESWDRTRLKTCDYQNRPDP
jgi:hypothetical protein